MTLLAGFGVIGITLVVITLLVGVFKCKHMWEFVDKTEFPAPIETATKNGISYHALWAEQIVKMSNKTVVIVLRCPKCGVAKILRETH